MTRIFFFMSLLFFMVQMPVKAQSWYPTNDTFPPASIQTIVAIDSDLYVGGSFTMNIGGVSTYGIAKWNGLYWDSLGIGIDVDNWGTYEMEPVYSIKKYNGEIYVGGEFMDAGYIRAPKLAKWNGTSWDSVNTIWNGPTGGVYAMEIYENKLYCGGAGLKVQDSTGDSLILYSMGKWNGAAWEQMPAGYPDGIVYSMIIFNNELYVGGGFGTAGGVPVYNIARWDGTQWKSCELGTSGASDMVIDTVNNKLYVLTGEYVVHADSSAVFTNGVSRWNGQEWEDIPPHYSVGKYALEIYHGELYAGAVPGGNQAEPEDSTFSVFNGKTWKKICCIDNTIKALEVYNDTLFVGGFFDKVIGSNGDTLAANSLVRWYTPNYCDSIHSPFTFSKDTTYLSDSGMVQFTPTGFCNQFQWDFGDGIQDTAQQPTHYYNTEGVYSVKLVATYGLCSWDSVVKTVVVINNLGIEEKIKKNRFRIYPNPAGDKISFSNNYSGNTITIINMLGKKIYSGKFEKELNVSFLPAGVYVIEVAAGEKIFRGKFVKE